MAAFYTHPSSSILCNKQADVDCTQRCSIHCTVNTGLFRLYLSDIVVGYTIHFFLFLKNKRGASIRGGASISTYTVCMMDFVNFSAGKRIL